MVIPGVIILLTGIIDLLAFLVVNRVSVAYSSTPQEATDPHGFSTLRESVASLTNETTSLQRGSTKTTAFLKGCIGVPFVLRSVGPCMLNSVRIALGDEQT